MASHMLPKQMRYQAALRPVTSAPGGLTAPQIHEPRLRGKAPVAPMTSALHRRFRGAPWTEGKA